MLFWYLVFSPFRVSPVVDEDEGSPTKDDNLSEQDRHLLVAYQRSFDDDNVDIGLILSLIHLIHSDNKPGESKNFFIFIMQGLTMTAVMGNQIFGFGYQFVSGSCPTGHRQLGVSVVRQYLTMQGLWN